MRIDAHHHFWKYNPPEYDWISEDMSVLQREFLPQDLAKEVALAGMSGVISVQARQTLEETAWLLKLASEHDFIQGIVGWMPLVSPRVESVLEEFASHKKLKAVRHVVQGEADGFLDSVEFNKGIATLKRFGLVYDVLIFERQLPEAIRFAGRHPEQVFVLNHIAKPRIQQGILEPWRTNIRELARRENVFCKVSGMVTETAWRSWKPEELSPYFEVVLEAFGPARLMFGSDWPVCLPASGYSRWVNTVEQFSSLLSPTEQQQLFGATATTAYGLNAG